MPVTYTDPQVNYYVEDVERAVRFYVENFGFVETYRTPKEGKPDHVEVKLGGLILGLASREAGKTQHRLPLGTEGGSPRVEIVLWTEDVDKAYAELISKGVPSITAPHTFQPTPSLILRVAWLMDPDGNPLEIVTRLKS